MTEKKFINIVSCGFRKDGWINLDKFSSHYSAWQSPIDLEHDLMTFNAVRLPDKCLDIAYTSHTIEHLSDEHVHHLFKEVYRILKPGGVFRITCPDIDKCYDAYRNKDDEYISNWKGRLESFRQLGIGERFLFLFASYLSPFHKSKVKKYTE
jgi:predicted SAM-dependent methyltransferase